MYRIFEIRRDENISLFISNNSTKKRRLYQFPLFIYVNLYYDVKCAENNCVFFQYILRSIIGRVNLYER